MSRILSLTNTPLDPTFGSGKTVLAWSRGLRALGHEVEVMVPDQFYRPWPGGRANRLKLRLDARKLDRQILQGGYDLVEFYGADFGWLTDRLACVPRRNRPLLVAHTNGLELLAWAMRNGPDSNQRVPEKSTLMNRLVDAWVRGCDAKAFSRADAFAAICQADADYVIDHRIQPKERCLVVEPGIDEVYRKAVWNGPKKHMLVTLGSWAPRKDPETIERVATRLLESDPELEFHVLGAPWLKDTIPSAFPESLRRRIVVYPRLEEAAMVDVLTQAKVFFFPSLYEGFGMATTEAMCCGCAVVVTPTGFGTSIQDGQDGFVCGFKDVDAMVDRIQKLLRDEALCRQSAAQGRARAEGLTWENQVRKLEQTYRTWLSELK